MEQPSAGQDGGQPGGGAPGAELPAVDSQALLAGRSSIRIRHAGETYSLRLTRKNRLILTK
ncbi:MAG: hemin uptake protein HemP [Geminicoccaceae bacterium]